MEAERGANGLDVRVRRLRPTDSLNELTALLHRAYAKQVSMGIHGMASHQSPEVTRRRVSRGECFVAVVSEKAAAADAALSRTLAARGVSLGAGRDGRGAGGEGEVLVGTIMFQEPSWGSGSGMGGKSDAGPRWFQRPDVANFSQFAVEPVLQGRGVGLVLLETVERRAREIGMAELSLSTAEPDAELVRFYERRGFRPVERFDWGVTNYVSVIMSKTLKPSSGG